MLGFMKSISFYTVYLNPCLIKNRLVHCPHKQNLVRAKSTWLSFALRRPEHDLEKLDKIGSLRFEYLRFLGRFQRLWSLFWLLHRAVEYLVHTIRSDHYEICKYKYIKYKYQNSIFVILHDVRLNQRNFCVPSLTYMSFTTVDNSQLLWVLLHFHSQM